MESKRVTEEIEPYCKWRRRPTYDIVEVHLHGFEDREIRVKCKNRGNLKISGKRPMDGTFARWKKIAKKIELPSRVYKAQDFNHKFDGGILVITIPKKGHMESAVDTIIKACAFLCVIIIAAYVTFKCQ
ncbi:hypothetical protein CJ030_MR2G016876 [Morella rubra]|uniref:SHSP domain-containing protein n=1 Tax=Morella rubra TaxID=262757 RepID=A0A6A1WIL9_9ROSI|nr:hypothetical protein CJ030_MR2G016876 [Morella rubra]